MALNACSIQSLPDPVLAKIFSHLPLKDRLQTSEVCKHWHHLSQADWLDVIDLDLTPIPTPNIGAVLRQSPNVASIFALRRFLIINDLTEHHQINLRSAKLFDVKMGLASITGDERHMHPYRNWWLFTDGYSNHSETECFRISWHLFLTPEDVLEAANSLISSTLNRYYEKLPQLDELVLHNLSITDLSMVPITSAIPFSIRTGVLTSLTRLQLSGSGVKNVYFAILLGSSLRELPYLECLLLHVRLYLLLPYNNLREQAKEFCAAVSSLKNLRELSISASFYGVWQFGDHHTCFCRQPPCLDTIALDLPKLEVLCLYSCGIQTFRKLYSSHPTLRVLMIFETWDPYFIDNEPPFTRHFSQPASSIQLPFLNVFLRHGAYSRLRFADSAAAKIFRIDPPIHEFFGVEEIAEILDGVWIAEMIQETASYDAQFDAMLSD